MLPTSFGSDFSDPIDHYATLVDTNGNEFEVKVEKIGGCIFLTTEIEVVRDFYDISLGAWLIVVFKGFGRFNIKKMVSRIKKNILFPLFDPLMRFAVDMNIGPAAIFNGFSASIDKLSYQHDKDNFNISYAKHLTDSDIKSGFLAR